MDITSITQFIVYGVLILSVFIEIVPVKWNPISWFGTKLFKKTNEKLDKLDRKVDGNEKERLRNEIMKFSTACQKGEKHTQEEFKYVLDEYDEYENILKRLGLHNGQMDVEIAYIRETYKRCLTKNHFAVLKHEDEEENPETDK